MFSYVVPIFIDSYYKNAYIEYGKLHVIDLWGVWFD